jgi:hypothetical protein
MARTGLVPRAAANRRDVEARLCMLRELYRLAPQDALERSLISATTFLGLSRRAVYSPAVARRHAVVGDGYRENCTRHLADRH